MNARIALAVLCCALLPRAGFAHSITVSLHARPANETTETERLNTNCRAITRLVNRLMAFHAATCQAQVGIVQIRATPEVRRRDQTTGFYIYALYGAGWSVNSEYFRMQDRFVVGNDAQLGCLQIEGKNAALEQETYQRTGNDFNRGALRIMALTQRVDCPAFLR